MTVANGFVPSGYGGSNLNQFTVYMSQWATVNSTLDNAPIFRWFQNSLIDPPNAGQPRPY